jgi:hypothetical protein
MSLLATSKREQQDPKSCDPGVSQSMFLSLPPSSSSSSIEHPPCAEVTGGGNLRTPSSYRILHSEATQEQDPITSHRKKSLLPSFSLLFLHKLATIALHSRVGRSSIEKSWRQRLSSPPFAFLGPVSFLFSTAGTRASASLLVSASLSARSIREKHCRKLAASRFREVR